MSDSPFPDAFEQDPGTAPEGSGGRPRLVLGAGLAAAVLLAGGGFLLLSGGAEEEEPFSVGGAAAPGAPAPTEASPEPLQLPADTEVNFARNPFEPQYIAPKLVEGEDGDGGSTRAPVTTPEIIEQSDPTFVPTQPSIVVVQQPTSQTPTSTPTTAPTQQPAPQPADDGVRYPITLMAINVTKEDDPGKYVSWGWEKEGFEVLPGQPFGRFKHLRVMQVIDSAEKQGVMLQMGDGSPYFVAVGETVYVL
ncbi:MAG TPA: hypothetical protein VNU66_12815 [Mycobacteriales bacterium]|nr:hypothetical protein [Mycobacteriales bacterium]